MSEHGGAPLTGSPSAHGSDVGTEMDMQSRARGPGIRGLGLGLLLVSYPCLLFSAASSWRDTAAHGSATPDSRIVEHRELRLPAGHAPTRPVPDHMPLPANDARNALRRLFLALLGPDRLCPATMRALVSRRAMVHGEVDQLPSPWQRALAPALAQIAMHGMAPEALLDPARGALDIQVESASPWGWRLQPRLTLAATAPPVVLPDVFVVHEDGAFRILAMVPMLAPLGAQALHLLSRGDLEGAGRWLDWARAHATTAGDGNVMTDFVTLWPEHGPRDHSAMVQAATSLQATGTHISRPRRGAPAALPSAGALAQR